MFHFPSRVPVVCVQRVPLRFRCPVSVKCVEDGSDQSPQLQSSHIAVHFKGIILSREFL